jgi:hypothetical protein
MTNFTKNFLVAAAALAVAAGGASAQSLKADIPFAFQVHGKVMPAGTYRVDQITAADVYRFRNDHSGQAVLVLPATKHDARKEWKAEGSAKLAFECGPASCALTELWDGTARPSYTFHRPKNVDMGTRIAIVNMRPDNKAD